MELARYLYSLLLERLLGCTVTGETLGMYGSKQNGSSDPDGGIVTTLFDLRYLMLLTDSEAL